MKIACDTNRYVDFCRGIPEAVATVQSASHIFMPVIVVAELRAGFNCGSRARQNERQLVRFLDSRRTQVLYVDDQTTHHYANLFLQLRNRGRPIPTNDLWIAAIVVQHNLTLWARDRHFDALPQIPRI